MLHFDLNDDAPIPRLAETIARQKSQGGYIIQYLRAWSALVVTMQQYRVEHVPFGHSRMLAGLKHSLFTLSLGIWSPFGLMRTPLILILNFRGGMDVTAKYSGISVDPLRDLPPTPGQGERDLKTAQWIFVVLGTIVVIGAIGYFVVYSAR